MGRQSVVLRAVMLWYWKVNEQVALAREQNQLLREVRDAIKALDFEITMEPDRHKEAESTARSGSPGAKT